ncbi:MAG: ketopantoate reductase family protein [Anaerolineales bacterium]
MNKFEAPSILIVGTGAMGCLFASRLAAAGATVQILGTWAEGIAALQNDGVRLMLPDGSEQVHRVIASSDPRDFSGASMALVMVKSWQTERAAGQLFQCLAVDGIALTLQNGLGNREKLVARLGAERVALGVTTLGASLLGPGRVRAGGEGRVSVENRLGVDPIVKALRGADYEVDLADDVDSLAWSKLVINAAINPLAAILDVPNGELLARPGACELSAALAREVAAVAAQKRIHLQFEDPVESAEAVARSTSANVSSMLQDIRRGARTEIDSICGAVVNAGHEVGVATPVNDIMWKLVGAMESVS